MREGTRVPVAASRNGAGTKALAWLAVAAALLAGDAVGAQADCTAAQQYLVDSGPITVVRDGEVIENLRVTSVDEAAIRVLGRANVVIRNVEILHAGGAGILLADAPGALIENVSITHTGAPPFGENPSPDRNNIDAYNSPFLTVRNARLLRGSSGIYLDRSPNAQLSFIEGHDFRGPFPRGQLVQFSAGSDDSSIEDFSVECPRETSYTEDNINVWHSSNVTVRRGLIDGNNSNSGVGVIAEHKRGRESGLLVEDVDAVRMGNGCFSAYPGYEVVFRRTRCRSNICEAQNRLDADGSVDEVHGGEPLSGGLVYAAGGGSRGVSVLESTLWDLCNPDNIVWPWDAFDVVDIRFEDFELRSPIRLSFCWEGGDGPPPPEPPPAAPVADAGPDQQLRADPSGLAWVHLDGSGSYDPDGTIVDHLWTDSGTWLASGATVAVQLPVGSHELTLTVEDTQGLTDSDSLTVTIQPRSKKPKNPRK